MVALVKLTEAAGVEPKDTVVAPTTKLAPVTVTAVPPVRGPWVGVMGSDTGSGGIGEQVGGGVARCPRWWSR